MSIDRSEVFDAAYNTANAVENNKMTRMCMVDRWIDGSTDRWVDDSIDGWIDGSMDRWVDGSIDG